MPRETRKKDQALKMWTASSAREALESVFGIEAVEEYMNRPQYEPYEIQDAIKQLNVVYGIDETKALFEVLGKEVPKLEEFPIERGVRQLETFSKTLWVHHFSKESLLDYIEVGTNHIVLYPKPTDIGRRLLACLVATMWNPANKQHFDPYESLKTDPSESSISFVLDHAGYDYSNPLFKRYNGADLLHHFHPVSGGSYHTHFYYGEQFPGLLAVYSILTFVHGFVDGTDAKLKATFEKEILDCITQYSHYVIDTLMDLLPPTLMFYDNATLNKLQTLNAMMLFIKEKGLFDEGLCDFEMVTLTDLDYTVLWGLLEFKDPLILRMLRHFIFDLKTYQANLKKFQSIQPLVEDEIVPLSSSETIKCLFRLSCCLTSEKQSPLEPLSKEELELKKVGMAAGCVKEIDDAILLADLKRVAKINHKTLLLLREEHKAVCSIGLCEKEFTDSASGDCEEVLPKTQHIDAVMVGYRERVAEAMIWTKYSFKFNSRLLSQGVMSAAVDRADTAKARQMLSRPGKILSETKMVISIYRLRTEQGLSIFAKDSAKDEQEVSQDKGHLSLPAKE